MTTLRMGLLLAVLATVTGRTRADPPAVPAPLFVYVANGAGSSTALTDGLGTAVKRAELRMAMKTVPWCRQPSTLKDYRDDAGQVAAGRALANEVCTLRHQCPNARIVLMSHSAGARVVLAAAEVLPPCTVDRVILFAPAVHAYYDVRPALRGSRLGIDSFHSPHDNLLNTLGESLGTSDGVLTTAAGVSGFALPFRSPDHATFQGLRQYGWHPVLGISGTHYSWTEPPFLARHALPMMMTP